MKATYPMFSTADLTKSLVLYAACLGAVDEGFVNADVISYFNNCKNLILANFELKR